MPRKRKQIASHSLIQEFAKQVKTEHANMKLLINTKGEVNMSDAIRQLVEPFKDDGCDYESFKGLVTLACVAWNTSLFPDRKREKIIAEMMDIFKGTIEEQVEIFNLLGELMERKRRLFPNVSRKIIEHKVTDREDDFHIAVASTLEKKGAKE